jgi:hypothetical protein
MLLKYQDNHTFIFKDRSSPALKDLLRSKIIAAELNNALLLDLVMPCDTNTIQNIKQNDYIVYDIGFYR